MFLLNSDRAQTACSSERLHHGSTRVVRHQPCSVPPSHQRTSINESTVSTIGRGSSSYRSLLQERSSRTPPTASLGHLNTEGDAVPARVCVQLPGDTCDS